MFKYSFLPFPPPQPKPQPSPPPWIYLLKLRVIKRKMETSCHHLPQRPILPNQGMAPGTHPPPPQRQCCQQHSAREPALPKLSAAFPNKKIKAGPASLPRSFSSSGPVHYLSTRERKSDEELWTKLIFLIKKPRNAITHQCFFSRESRASIWFLGHTWHELEGRWPFGHTCVLDKSCKRAPYCGLKWNKGGLGGVQCFPGI